MKYYIIILISAVYISGLFLSATDIDTLRTRIALDYLSTTDTTQATDYFNSQNPNGSWNDIIYTSKDVSDWSPIKHLRRLRCLAAAFHTPTHPYYQDANVKAAISLGLNYWFTKKATSDNWWQNDVNKPQELGPTAVIMFNDLSASQITQTCAEFKPYGTSWTAQNVVYSCFGQIYRGVLKNSSADITTALDAIKRQVRITTAAFPTAFNTDGEGIRVDGTFFQHGAKLYNGLYGLHFLKDVPYWMAMTDGLSFGFTPEQKSIIVNHVLDGQQWMVRNTQGHHSVDDRKISQDNYQYVTFRYETALADGLAYLQTINPPRAAELDTFVRRIRGEAVANLTGNKHFFKGDYQVQARDNYHATVKLVSSRTMLSEEGNGDNLQGYYLSVGSTFIYPRGDEYRGIFPTWDWGHIPGTTTPHKNPAPKPATWGTTKGRTAFVGGVSDGVNGVAVQALDYDATTGLKSWFFFDEGFMALGVGINSSSTYEINTTLNQCFSRGAITLGYVDGTENVLSGGSLAKTNIAWVFHDNVGYIFPSNQAVNVASALQSGSWFEINDSLSASTLTNEVFSLWINHGVKPTVAAYSYLAIPGIDVNSFKTLASNNPIQILQNTPSIQGVTHAGIGLSTVVFRAAGSIQINPSLLISVDNPCLVICRDSAQNPMVTVADPTTQLSAVSITVIKNGVTLYYNFSLPSGDLAGKSVSSSTPTVADPPPPPAPSVTATASTFSKVGYEPDKTLDGNFDTAWSANGIGQWIKFDLNAVRKVTDVNLAFVSGNQRVAYFDVLTSTDNSAWLKVLNQATSSGTTSGLEYFNVTDSIARYVKIVCRGNSLTTWNTISEILIGTNGPPPTLRQVATPAPMTPQMAGSLKVSGATALGNYDLSSQGSLDWARWGNTAITDYDHKLGVAPQIGKWIPVGQSLSQRLTDDNVPTFSWGDGTIVTLAEPNNGFVAVGGSGNGFQLLIPAAISAKTLRLYCGVQGGAVGELEVSLSDNSAPAVIRRTNNSTVYKITFNAAARGRILDVRYVSKSGSGRVFIQAASLE